MNVTVNGEDRDVADGTNLTDLLRDASIDPEQTATLVNDELVPAAHRESFVLQPGSRVELLTFAGGG